MKTLQALVDAEVAAVLLADAQADAAVLAAKDAAYAALKAQFDAYKLAHPDITPVPDPVPTPTPTLTWPKVSTTGVKAGVSLTVYTGQMTITIAGTIIENKIINGTLTINAANVKIRNCRFQNFAWYAILAENQTPEVTDCTFDGKGSVDTKAFAGKGGTILRNNISGMVIAVDIWGGPATIEGNYIHDLDTASTDPNKRHFDGIALLGGSKVVIRNNAIDVFTGTACTFLSSQNSVIDDVLVENNLLLGQASYTAYAEKSTYAMTNVRYINNYIEKGIYPTDGSKYAEYILNNSGSVDQGNVKWQDGKDPVPAAVVAWRAAI